VGLTIKGKAIIPFREAVLSGQATTSVSHAGGWSSRRKLVVSLVLTAVIAASLATTYEVSYGNGSDCGYANGFANGQVYGSHMVLVSSETTFQLSPGAEVVIQLLPLIQYAGNIYTVPNVTVSTFSGTFAAGGQGNSNATAEMYVDIGGGPILTTGYGSTGGLGPGSFVQSLTGESEYSPVVVIRANPDNNGTARVAILEPIAFSLSPSPPRNTTVCPQQA